MNIIDLFAGCGGLSLGFQMAGFNIPLAVERDEWAALTYKNNHSGTVVITEDITEIKDFKRLLKNSNTSIDGIIGGPPCQGFSLSGNRDRKDPRNSLFMDFLRFVQFYNPRFFVMENVPGICSMRTASNILVTDLIMNEFENIGYSVEIIKLNAAEFGVPQSRVRVFFIGIRDDIPYKLEDIKPVPFLFGDEQISIEDAIMDLPEIESGEGTEVQYYQKKPATSYQTWARGNSVEVYNHIAMRHTKRIIERFNVIKHGQSVADVCEVHGQRKRGEADRVSGKIYSQNNMRPFPDRPSPTIAASFQSNFVHPFFNRNYTAREGARLQSFPDTYIFYGKRTTMSWEKNLSQYQQIGNAVPPLLAKAVASKIKEFMN